MKWIPITRHKWSFLINGYIASDKGHRALNIKDAPIHFAGMTLFPFKRIFLPITVVQNAYLLGHYCKQPWANHVSHLRMSQVYDTCISVVMILSILILYPGKYAV